MARNLYSTVGECKPDNGVADNLIRQKRFEVFLPAGVEFKRGQVLLIDEAMNASLPTASTMKIDVILLDDIGLTDDITPAAALFTGEWNENETLWGDIPDANISKVILNTRDKGLHIDPMNKAPYVMFGEVQ